MATGTRGRSSGLRRRGTTWKPGGPWGSVAHACHHLEGRLVPGGFAQATRLRAVTFCCCWPRNCESEFSQSANSYLPPDRTSPEHARRARDACRCRADPRCSRRPPATPPSGDQPGVQQQAPLGGRRCQRLRSAWVPGVSERRCPRWRRPCGVRADTEVGSHLGECVACGEMDQQPEA